jgi:TolA-binding protein
MAVITGSPTCLCMRAFYERIKDAERARDLLLSKHIQRVKPGWVKGAIEEAKTSLEITERECNVSFPEAKEKWNEALKHIDEGEYTLASFAVEEARRKLLECK